MFADRALLADLAERIASTEHRHGQLRIRIERLREEGSNASQEEELLGFLASELAQLYERQAMMRRSSWATTRAA